jgi:hypothetical protein
MPVSITGLHPKSTPTTAASIPKQLADQVREIERIGERISAIVRFMCDIQKLPGTSEESRDRALTAFHEPLIMVEKQLVHIQEKFRLE